MRRSSLLGSAFASTLFLLAWLPQAQADDPFAGKTIIITTHSAPGGQYDAYCRVLARFYGKYIPGNPAIQVLNRVGAGGLLAVNNAMTAPRDGTLLTLVANGLVLFQGIGMSGLRASLEEFNWIGNFNASNGVTVVMADAGVKTIEEARTKEVIIGSSGAGSISALLPTAYNAFAGTKFRVVQGYEGAAHMNLSMRRGEIQGRSGAPWLELQSDFPEESREGRLIPLSQIGTVRDPMLPNVPLLTEIAVGDERNLAAARFVSDSLTQTRSLAAPPGVPAEVVAILRTAFQNVLRDTEYVAQVHQAGLELNPTTGEHVQATIQSVLKSPASLREYVKNRLDPQKK